MGNRWIASAERHLPGRVSEAAEVTWAQEYRSAASVFRFPSLDVAGFDLQFSYLEPNFLFEPIPEPSTALLVSAGLAAMAARRRTLVSSKHQIGQGPDASSATASSST